MSPQHRRTVERFTFVNSEIPDGLHEGYLQVGIAGLPKVLMEGLDQTHEFVNFRGSDSDDLKLPLNDVDLIARASDPDYACAITAYQHGYDFARRKPSNDGRPGFSFHQFPGIVGTQLHVLGEDAPHDQKAYVASTTLALSEKFVQEAISERLFTRVREMSSPLVNEHAVTSLATLLASYNPQSYLHAAKLANRVFDEHRRINGRRGVTELQEQRLKLFFDAIAADNPKVGELKYQMVHDGLRMDTQRPPTVKGRLRRLTTGELDERTAEQLRTRYAGYDKYLPRDDMGVGVSLLVPRPSLGQQAASASIERLAEVDPAKAARKVAISGMLAGAFGGIVNDAAFAAPERPAVSVSTFEAKNVAAFSAVPSLAEKGPSSDKFQYDAKAEQTIQRMLTAANGDPVKTRIAVVMRELMKGGLYPHEAAGMIGDFRVEGTSEMLPGVEERTANPQKGFGMGQWTGGRRDNLIAFANEHYNGRYADPVVQAKFVIYELNTYESQAYAELKKTTNAHDAARIIAIYYERPNAYAMRQSMSKRTGYAVKAHDDFMHFYGAPEVPDMQRHPHPNPATNNVKADISSLLSTDSATPSTAVQQTSFEALLSNPDNAVAAKVAADKAAIRASLDALLGPGTPDTTEAPAGIADTTPHVAKAHMAALALDSLLAAPHADGTPHQVASTPAAGTPAPSSVQGGDVATPTKPLSLDALLADPAQSAPANTPAATPSSPASGIESGSSAPAASSPVAASAPVMLGASTPDTQAASAVPAVLLSSPDVQPVAALGDSAPAATPTDTAPASSLASSPSTAETTPTDLAQTPPPDAAAPAPTSPATPVQPSVTPAPAEKKTDAPKPPEVNPQPAPGKETKCAPGSTSLGMYQTSAGNSEMCALIELKSAGEESNPSSNYYMKGANGHAIVRAEVSSKYVALIDDAQKHGITFQTVNSSFRTVEHQADLYYTTSDHTPGAPHRSRNLVAPPGGSEHNKGDAVDFHIIGADSSKCEYDSNHNCTAPHDEEWRYLAENADKFGLGVYKLEAWHVDDNSGHWASYMGNKQ